MTEPRLRAGISKFWRKAFILEEDCLRRIQAILQKAAKDLPDPKPAVVFRVEREDDRFYETTEIADVLADPNVAGKRVILVSAELRSTHESDSKSDLQRSGIAIANFAAEERYGRFTDRNEVTLRISTGDRNWGLLLADEIEPQIQRTFKAKAIPRPLLILPFAPLIYLIIRLGGSSTSILSTIALVTTSLFLGAMVSVMGKSQSASRWFGPESAFLWGDEAQAYANREQNRRHVLWGVIVAFLVSLAGSIVASLMFLPKQ